MNALALTALVGGLGALGALARVGLDDAWIALRARRAARDEAAPGEGAGGEGDEPLAAPTPLVALRTAAMLWPWPLLAVNVVGSAVLGWVLAAWGTSSPWETILGTGFCGGLTTFSTWSVAMAGAGRDRAARRGASLLLAHLVVGVSAAWIGWKLG